MKLAYMSILALVPLSTATMAQSGPVAQQSSDDLVCQLSGDCGGAVEASEDKPDSRGFSISKPSAGVSKTAPRTAKPVAAPTSANAVKSGVRRAEPARARYAPQGGSSAKFAVAQPGRADMMVTFVSGSAILTEQAKVNVNQFVKALASPKLASMKFAIEGHTDAVGSRALNQDLSRRRAQAVVDYLTAQGVDSSRFDVRAYGFDRPLNSKNPRASVNRRVEVVRID